MLIAIVAIADEYFGWSFRRHACADCKRDEAIFNAGNFVRTPLSLRMDLTYRTSLSLRGPSAERKECVVMFPRTYPFSAPRVVRG